MLVCYIVYMGVIYIDAASIIPGVVVYDKKIITWVILSNSRWCDITPPPPPPGGGDSQYILVGVCRSTSKKGGLRHGHTQKKEGLRHGYNPKKGDLKHGHESKKGVLGTDTSRKKGVLRTGLVKKTILVTDVAQ